MSRLIVDSARRFGKVAVMLGGTSSEREVSLDSGGAVLKALLERDVDAHAWDPAERQLADFAAAGFDRAFIALHGAGGEDGTLQGALEWLGTPYTGSGVMASALAMDKVRSKRIFTAAGLPTPVYHAVASLADARLAADALGLPLIVKPDGQGSSVGMSKVFELSDLEAAIAEALRFSDLALLERCIVGDELTVAVLDGEALPSVRIETPRVFYDYRAKYASDRTEYHCPGIESAAEEARLKSLASDAFDALGCRGWGRVDFMVGHDREPMILEVNTVPGMTSHSLVPMAARAAGIDFEELCWRILATSVTAADAAVNTSREVANGA
ncbi:MAG: D-alanine--D-alanine ligase [Pseudomonadota bacterium]